MSRYLKEKNTEIRIVALRGEYPHVFVLIGYHTGIPVSPFHYYSVVPTAEQERADVRESCSCGLPIQFIEQVWSRDLSEYDADGPLPELDPDPDAEPLTWGRVRHEQDQLALAAKWRSIAEERKLSIRELVIEVTARQQFVGTPRRVAETINEYVQSDAADGFVLVPHLTPVGLDEFVDKVVPELQELGVFRTDYAGPTLREHLFRES